MTIIIILPVNAKHTIDEKPTKLNERNTYFRWSFPFIQISYNYISSILPDVNSPLILVCKFILDYDH